MAGLTVASAERLSPHGLRAGFVTEAYRAGARDEQIMDHTRHRDLNTMRGYVRRAKLVTESPVKLLDLERGRRATPPRGRGWRRAQAGPASRSWIPIPALSIAPDRSRPLRRHSRQGRAATGGTPGVAPRCSVCRTRTGCTTR